MSQLKLGAEQMSRVAYCASAIDNCVSVMYWCVTHHPKMQWQKTTVNLYVPTISWIGTEQSLARVTYAAEFS